MSLPWECSLRYDEVPMTTSTPSTPVSTAILASSMWQRTWVRILAYHRALVLGELCGAIWRSDLEAELADRLAVAARLLRGSRRGQLDVVDAEVIEGLGNLDLGLGVEEGVGELLAFSQGALDDLEARDIAEEVAHGLVGIRGAGGVGVLVGLSQESGLRRSGFAARGLTVMPVKPGWAVGGLAGESCRNDGIARTGAVAAVGLAVHAVGVAVGGRSVGSRAHGGCEADGSVVGGGRARLRGAYEVFAG